MRYTLWQIRDSALETVVCNLAPEWPVKRLTMLTWPKDGDMAPEIGGFHSEAVTDMEGVTR